MRDLAIDPVTGDLALDASGQVHLTEGVEAVAQRLRIRLRLIRQEYVLDRRVGIPYLSLLGVKGGRARLEAVLRNAARTCPGVASLDAFRLDVDTRRNATVTLTVRTLSGEPISLDAFSITDTKAAA